MRASPISVLLALPLLVAGCASSSSSTGSNRNPNLLTFEELRSADLSSLSLEETIRRLRPRWLRSRGTSISGGQTFPVVFVGGARFGEIDTLGSIRTNDVEEVRFINARDATTRFGTGYPGGVISVTIRR